MAEKSNEPENFWAPKYWGTWLAIGLLHFCAKLGLQNQVRVGRVLGHLGYWLVKRRRKITEVNIRLCFPELDENAQKKLVKECMIQNAIGIIETGRVWFADPETMDSQMEVEGLEHMQKALADGKGVIVVGAHYSILDIACLISSRLFDDFYGHYRPQKNQLMDKIMREARLRLGHIIDRQDMRTLVKAMKEGHIIWYANDQDYGPDVSVFAPFFGIQAATIRTPSKLAKVNNSPVIVTSFHRKPDNSGYIMRFMAPLESFPSGDDVADATRINEIHEREIRRCPEQYMWVHRRFKTRPPGEPGFY